MSDDLRTLVVKLARLLTEAELVGRAGAQALKAFAAEHPDEFNRFVEERVIPSYRNAIREILPEEWEAHFGRKLVDDEVRRVTAPVLLKIVNDVRLSPEKAERWIEAMRRPLGVAPRSHKVGADLS